MSRILIVDDDPLVSSALKTCLEYKRFKVVVANGGSNGLKEIERAAFDLIVVDIFMPHMDGFESIRLFRQHAPEVPLIAISGHAFSFLNSPTPDFLTMALRLGATRCLRKPFTTAAIVTVINECLEGQYSFPGAPEMCRPDRPDGLGLSAV